MFLENTNFYSDWNNENLEENEVRISKGIYMLIHAVHTLVNYLPYLG